MTIRTGFLISIYALTALAGGILGYAEGNNSIALATIPIAALAYVFGERLGWLRLSALYSNVLGTIAVCAAGLEFFGPSPDAVQGTGEAQLLSGAHLLVYLTWSVLLQKKEIRHYWWLCALGLLEVAVASLLTSSVGFGGLLVLYVLCAILTLTTFNAYQAWREFGGQEPARQTLDGEGDSVLPAADRNGDETHEIPDAVAATQPLDSSTSAGVGGVRWGIAEETRAAWIHSRFVGTSLGTAVFGIVVGFVFFLCVPRLWGDGPRPLAERQEGRARRALTGFSKQVQLGDISEILESNAPVMHIRMYWDNTQRELDVEDFANRCGMSEPLFRGKSLEKYEDGRWSEQERMKLVQSKRYHTLLKAPPRQPGSVRQEIVLESTGSDVLFAMRPVDAGAYIDADVYAQDYINVDLDTLDLIPVERGSGVLKYRIWSHIQTAGQPLRDYLSSGTNGVGAKTWYLQLPAKNKKLEMLRVRARELTREERLVAAPQRSMSYRKAMTLLSHLRDSGIYQYALTGIAHDPDLDPVVHFLTKSKRGHCEYFASALALMLRAVGVPARLVNGFKGGHVNPLTRDFEVQQRHAHSWVEAMIDGDWMVLDPTPGARDEALEGATSGINSLPSVWENFSAWWTSYVVRLSLQQQKEALFDPVKLFASGASGFLGEKDQESAARNAALRSAAMRTFWIHFLAWFVSLSLLCLAAKYVAGLRSVRNAAGLRILWRLLERIFPRLERKDGEVAAPRIEFFERFLECAAKHGKQIGHDQTPREFAGDLQQTFAIPLNSAGLFDLPETLVDTFYAVRFGDRPLGPVEESRLFDQVRQFEACLRDQRTTAV